MAKKPKKSQSGSKNQSGAKSQANVPKNAADVAVATTSAAVAAVPTTAARAASPAAGAKPRLSKREKARRQNIAIGAGVATMIVAGIAIQVVRQMNLPGESFRSQGNVHLASVVAPHIPYNSNPPTSGPHMPSVAAWRSYTEPVEDEYLVHNMEDAGVILWYDMGTPEENLRHVELLEEVARGYTRIIIAPREDLGSQYVLTAWTRLQRFDEIDQEAMVRFIDAYEGIDHHPR
jgi:hypothetical protein